MLNKTYNPAETGFVEGVVTDAATGQPIEGAIVMSLSWLYFDNIELKNKHYWNNTFTDVNGYYKVIPFNYHPSNFGNNKTVLLRCFAPGTNLNGADIGDRKQIQLTPSTQNFSLQRANFNYDQTIVTSVPQGVNKNFKGWNTLLASTTTQLNGISDLTAREEINLAGEVHISNTAEVHVYTAPSFHDCINYTGYRTARVISENGNETHSEKEIILSFINESNFDLVVYPMPNKGIFTVQFTGRADYSKTTIIIKNVMGQIMHSTTTELNTVNFKDQLLAKGIYFIEAANNKSQITKKLIIQ